MKIKIISELREFDAAIMELGLEYSDKMAIPQGLTAFPLSGYCISDCTNVVSEFTGKLYATTRLTKFEIHNRRYRRKALQYLVLSYTHIFVAFAY